MIIINLSGGLGNQMFQYAFGRIRSKKAGMPLKVHFVDALFCTKRNFSLDCFSENIVHASTKDISTTGFPQSKIGRIIYRISKHLKISSLFFPFVINEENYQKIIHDIDKKQNYYIEGYWQEEKYFGDISKLPNIFRYSKMDSSSVKNTLDKIKKSEAISLHVRRGDYVTSGLVNKTFKPCGQEYYSRSIRYINKIIKKPTYFVFSDDICWAKKYINTNYPTYFVTNNKPWEDMYLMSQCKHNIIANSSFSLWSALLNNNKNKTVIFPKKWTTKSYAREFTIIPKNWITINN